MRSVTVKVIILLAFVGGEASARELMPPQNATAQDAMDSMVNSLLNKLAVQVHKVYLDNTTLGKPSYQKVPQLGVNTMQLHQPGLQFMAPHLMVSNPGGRLSADSIRTHARNLHDHKAHKLKPGDPFLRITLRGYDVELLEQTSEDIIDVANRTGAGWSGPVRLPNKIKKWSILRSPHVNKNSFEQFEIRRHKRLIDISSVDSHCLDGLMGLEIPTQIDLALNFKQA